MERLIVKDVRTENKMCHDIASLHPEANLHIIKTNGEVHNYTPYLIHFFKDWIMVKYNGDHIWYNMSDISRLVEQKPETPINEDNTSSREI